MLTRLCDVAKKIDNTAKNMTDKWAVVPGCESSVLPNPHRINTIKKSLDGFISRPLQGDNKKVHRTEEFRVCYLWTVSKTAYEIVSASTPKHCKLITLCLGAVF